MNDTFMKEKPATERAFDGESVFPGRSGKTFHKNHPLRTGVKKCRKSLNFQRLPAIRREQFRR